MNKTAAAVAAALALGLAAGKALPDLPQTREPLPAGIPEPLRTKNRDGSVDCRPRHVGPPEVCP